MIYVFGDYALDTHLYELRHGGKPCPLGPQVFNVPAYLMAHRERVVTKEELIAHLGRRTASAMAPSTSM